MAMRKGQLIGQLPVGYVHIFQARKLSPVTFGKYNDYNLPLRTFTYQRLTGADHDTRKQDGWNVSNVCSQLAVIVFCTRLWQRTPSAQATHQAEDLSGSQYRSSSPPESGYTADNLSQLNLFPHRSCQIPPGLMDLAQRYPIG